MAGAAGQRNQLANVPVVERAVIREGSVSLTYPMLSRDNYASWAIKVRVFMEAQGVWDAVEPPTGTVVDNRMDKMALAAIYQGIPEDVLLAIAEKRTAKEAWLALKTMHLGADRVKNAKVQTLRTEFELLRMRDVERLDEFALKLTSLVNRIRGLGQQIEEVHVVKKFLRAVSSRFLPIVSTIEQFGDIDTMSLDEAIGRLKAHEERAHLFEENEGDKLLLQQSESASSMQKHMDSSKWSTDGGNKEQRCVCGRVYGQEKKKRDKSKVRCYKCDQLGHFASECDKKPTEEANLACADEEPTLM